MKSLLVFFLSTSVFFSLEADELNSGEYFVIQSWSQESDYKRQYFVSVPDEPASAVCPVLISLHGNGGNAKRAMENFMRRYKTISSNYILVFPQGYKASWNIVSERAKSDDLGFIEEIVTTLSEFENVKKDDFTVMGNSNGAALVNQIAIETKLSSIKNYISCVSPLNSFQHDGKNFKAKGSDNDYKSVATPMVGKRLLNISGEIDRLVPYTGGPSRAIPAKDGKLPFLHAEESIFVWAKHFGYPGEKLTKPTAVEGKLEKYSYLDGDVVHYKVVGGGHGLGNALTEAMLLEFLDEE